MAGYTLILAILILGGIIATLGDRIGSKVGRARLSIFNLRPRNTATLVTIVTGGAIAASTLGILLASSSQLRDGLFQLESIRADLSNTQAEKLKVEKELNTARTEQGQAQQRLDQINKSLAQALLKQSQTQSQLKLVEGKFQEAQTELQKVQEQEATLRDRVQSLSSEQEKLQAESQKLAQERDQLTSDLARITTERESLRQKVAESETSLKAIEQQRTQLITEVSSLETSRDQLLASIQALRTGNVAILSDQLLAIGVIRPKLSRDELREATNQLLLQAEQNSRALLDFLPGQAPQDRVIRVTQAQVAALVDKISDGRSYVVRILSAGNYLKRETAIMVSADVTPNRQVFTKGEVIASLQFKPNLSERELTSRVEQVFLLVSFRARREGVLADPITGKVGTFSPEALNNLLQKIRTLQSPFEIQAVAKETIFTASTLTLELIVRQDGVEVGRFD
ncbi:DUF3084 domain-containing protein [Tumidithrix elongata RA019]|uniref:DUF3084 domain-containing protein n=1 Tax=Tumidithrix elongata BACA0141 TaxID=2716417 RepID=A0AAW9PUH0_9CYAN|nr:DUF3084 domain-containing protein [Tumidithrix elongata RA019]